MILKALFLASVAVLATALSPGRAAEVGKVPAAPLPAGGEVLFPGGASTELKLIDLPESQRRPIAATDPDLSAPFEVDVDRQGSAPWSFLLLAHIDAPMKKDDVGLVSFWARCAYSMTGAAQLAVTVEDGRPPKPKMTDLPMTVGSQWQRVDVPFLVDRDYPAGRALISIRLGFAKHRVQFAGVRVLNYGQRVKYDDLPRVATSYAGREADAAWRKEALARIERIRKGDLTVRVVDPDGRPVRGASVRATLRKHAFGFGTCISMKLLEEGPDAERYRETVKELFNHAVIENELKWPAIVKHRYENSDRLVQWLLDNGLDVRGHVLVWPAERYLPREAVELGGQPDKLRALILEHIDRTARRYTGKLIDWDVVNEPRANHWAMDRLGGNDVMVDWFTAAHAADPHARLYLNEYEILASGDMLDTPQQNFFYNAVRRLQEQGAPIHGVGMQGHFGSNITRPERMLTILDRFASLGVRIKVTELDVNIGDDALRADYFRDVFITLFSHPAVDGIMQWGFWEGSHWIPSSALFRRDWSVRPHGQVFLDLMRQWRTDVTLSTDTDGAVTLRGFKGEYDVEVRAAGRASRHRATISDEQTRLDVTLR